MHRGPAMQSYTHEEIERRSIAAFLEALDTERDNCEL
jgi:hypothetical protein